MHWNGILRFYKGINQFNLFLTSSQTLPAATLTDGVYQWTVTGTIDEFATKQAVIDAVKSFDATVGQQFINWVGENGFGVDQRGVARNVNKMQAGAYDAGL